MYPSADDNKVYLRCDKSKAITVLKVLYHLIECASQDFPDEAIPKYFGENRLNPAVHNHPRATPQLTAYSPHLANHITAANPQDEGPTPPPEQNRATRTRGGQLVHNTTATQCATYAGIATGNTAQTNFGAIQINS